MEILTPDMVIQELNRLIHESAKAPNAIYDAECLVVDRENEYERIYTESFLNSEGSVEARKAIAMADAREAKLQLGLAKAELNRVKNKLDQINKSGILVSTIGKQVEMTYRHG